MRASRQRSRGEWAYFHPAIEIRDRRGDYVRVASTTRIPARVAMVPDRSSRAETPGQVEVDVIHLLCPVLPGVDLWARVEFRGDWYDIVAPVGLRGPTSALKHWTVVCRKRPDGPGELIDPGDARVV